MHIPFHTDDAGTEKLIKGIEKKCAACFPLPKSLLRYKIRNDIFDCTAFQFIMHYGILTYGSRGDVQPFIALALGLQHKVIL